MYCLLMIFFYQRFSQQITAHKNENTLKTRWMSILRPSFPGYLPAILAAVRSNMLAPTSLQTAWTSIFFPVPRGPARRIDFVRGACSWTAWDPLWARKIYINEWKHYVYLWENNHVGSLSLSTCISGICIISN